MAKDVKKKFTISLDIGVREAEQQLKSAAANIKQTLNNIAQETNSLKYFNELHKQMSQVDALMGAMKNKYGDGFEDIFKQIGASMGRELSGVFDIANDKLNEFKTGIAGEEQKLNNLKALLSDFNKASKQGKQAIDGDDITSFKGTKKEVQELYASFDELVKKKSELESAGDFSSERYIKNYVKLMKTAAGLVNADNLSFNEGKYFGINENALNQKAEEASKILQNMFSKGLTDKGSSSYVYDWINSSMEVAKKSMSDMAEAMAETMKDSIHKALHSEEVTQGQVFDTTNMANDIKIGTDGIVDAIEYGKKKIVDAWKDYYDAVMDAKNQGIAIETGEESTYAMDKTKKSIEDMLDKWNVSGKSKFEILSLDEYIIDEDITSVEQIEKYINDAFEKYNIKLDIPIEEISPKTAGAHIDEIVNVMDSVEIKVNDVSAGFKKLIEYISVMGHDPGSFFEGLEDGTQALDENIVSILSSLNLLDKYGKTKLTSIQSGYSNTGGMISDDYVLISRDEDKLPFSMATKQKSLDAKAMGANIGAVLEVYEDKVNGIIYELQNKVEGKAILDFEKGIVNTEFLSATEEQIKKLISDLEILRKTGLFVDWNGSNVLYDKNTGFSFIDFFADSVTPYTVGKENGIQENLQMFFDKILKDFDLSGSDSLDVMAFKNDVESLIPVVTTQQKAQANIADTTDDVRIATDAVSDSIKGEELVHEQNTDAINAENKALQAQIELKKKAQSMKWEEFALDESLTKMKAESGLQTLSDTEKFWKQANYDKHVDFYELSKSETDDIINDNLDYSLRSAWYGAHQDFSKKTIIENKILANDELRNAALNKSYQLYKQYVDDTIAFADFLNTEFEVYRGDDYPIIFGDEQKPSFSFRYNTGNNFGSVESTKIIPKETVGNVTIPSMEYETEIWVPSSKLPYVNDAPQSFGEYYSQLADEKKKTLDSMLVQLEAQRVQALLGDDITEKIELASNSVFFKHDVLDNFKNGVIPDTINGVGNMDMDSFAASYNKLSDIQKRLVAYYVSLRSQSEYMDKVWGSDLNDISGDDLISATVNDKEGVKKHVAGLTGEAKFKLFGDATQDIGSEIEAHKENTQAISAEQQAQNALNDAKQVYSEVQHKIAAAVLAAEDGKDSELNSIWNSMSDVFKTEIDTIAGNIPSDILNDGYYQDQSTGELLSYDDIIEVVNNFEKTYGDNLDYVKDYLNKVFSGYIASMPDVDFVSSELGIGAQDNKSSDFVSVKDKLSKLLNSVVDDEYDYLEELYGALNGMKKSDPDLIKNGEFTDDWGLLSNVTDFFKEIGDYETKYGKDLQFVKDYVNDVFSEYLSQLGKTDAVDDVAPVRYTDIQDKLFDLKSGLMDDHKWDQYDELNDIFYSFSSMHNEQDLDNGTFKNLITKETTHMADLLDSISEYELKYGENLQYVKDHVNKVFEKYNAQIDAFLSGDSNAFANDSSDFEDELILDGFELSDDDIYGHKEATRPAVVEQQLEAEQQITAEKRQQAQLDASEEQTGADVSNIENESIALHNLMLKVQEVEQAVKDKTQAFIDEGSTVDQVVQQELLALAKLSVALDEIKLAVGNIGNISITGDIDESNLQNVDIPAVSSDDINEHREIDTGYALDQTLLTTNSILENILAAINSGEQNAQLSDALNGAITELKNVASGIVQHQKAQQTDKSAASAKIANNYGQLSDISGNAVSSFGDEAQVKHMKALADGVVRVEGAVRETDGVWKGFVVDIDESNNAVIRAIDEHSTFAKTLNEEAEAAKKAAEKAKTESPENKFNQSLSVQKLAFNDYRKSLQDVDYLNDKVTDGLDELALRLQNIADADGLQEWVEDFDDLKNEISTAETVFSNLEKEKVKKFKGQLNSEFKNLDFTTTTSDPTDEQKEILDLRTQLMEQLEKYKLGIKDGKAVELDVLNATMSALREKINLYREANNLESGGKQKFGATVALNATAKFNSLQQKANSGEFANSAVIQQALAQYETAYNNLIAKRKELSQVEGSANDVQKAEFKQLQDECNNYAKALNKIITDSQKLESQFVNPDSYFLGDDFEDSIEGRKAALTDFVQQMYGVSVSVEDFKNNWNEVVFAVDNGDGTFTNMTATFNAARTQIGALAGDVEKVTGTFESFVNELKSKFKSLSAYLISSLSIHEVWQQVRKGIEHVKEIDLALTELKKVTDATKESYDRFLDTASDVSGKIGATVSDFTEASANFAGLGYTIEESAKMAETAIVYKNVADGIDNVEEATDSIISTMKAFGIESSNTMGIIDVFNEVGKQLPKPYSNIWLSSGLKRGNSRDGQSRG